MFKKIRTFFQDIRIEHSLFALPFAYLGLFMARGGWPHLFVFVWVTIAMVSFRTMAMGLNRLFDRSIDTENPRTSGRALPQRRIRVTFVWGLVITAFLIFEASAFRLGSLCFLLSPVPLALAFLYPFTKRFTWFSHFVLGLILGIAPYGAWIATTRQFAWAPFFLTLGVTVWVAGFDMIYALQDIDFDIRRGLFSFPARFGIVQTLKTTRWLHGAAVLCWAAAGFLNRAGLVYGLGLVLVIYFLIREHQLIRSSGIARMNEAFFVMNAVVSMALCLSAILDLVM